MFFCHRIVCCCVITLTIDVESNSRANNITNNNIFFYLHIQRDVQRSNEVKERKKGIKTHIFLLFNQFFCCVAQALGAKERAHETEKVQWRSKLFMELVQYENLFKDITFLIGAPCSSRWERWDKSDDEINVIFRCENWRRRGGWRARSLMCVFKRLQKLGGVMERVESIGAVMMMRYLAESGETLIYCTHLYSWEKKRARLSSSVRYQGVLKTNGRTLYVILILKNRISGQDHLARRPF